MGDFNSHLERGTSGAHGLTTSTSGKKWLLRLRAKDGSWKTGFEKTRASRRCLSFGLWLSIQKITWEPWRYKQPLARSGSRLCMSIWRFVRCRRHWLGSETNESTSSTNVKLTRAKNEISGSRCRQLHSNPSLPSSGCWSISPMLLLLPSKRARAKIKSINGHSCLKLFVCWWTWTVGWALWKTVPASSW